MSRGRFAAGLRGLLGVLLLWAAPGPGPSLAATPQPGDRGFARTVVTGQQIEEIPLTFLGTYVDFAGPGYDLYLVQLEGPVADRVGVAAGMSGSPVFLGDELVGALSYRMGAFPEEAIGGVTPIEQMRGAADRAAGLAAAAAAEDAVTRPIATPVHVGGLSPAVRRWAAPLFREHGLSPVAGGSGGATAGHAPLRGGSPVGAELVRGDLSIGATGTVTAVDDGRVLAFGHPFLGAGAVEVPMVSAEVLHTLADSAGSFKMSNTGDEIGAIVGDRLTAIVGRLGSRARMIPVELQVNGAGYDRVFRFEVARSWRLTPLLAAVSVANALLSHNAYEQQATLLTRGRLVFDGRPDLDFEIALTAAGGGDPSLSTAATLQRVIAGVWNNPHDDPRIRGVEMAIDVASGVRRYDVDGLHFDRRPVRPGEPLRVEVVLSPYRGEPLRRTLTLDVPADLDPGTTVMLVVGSPDRVERAMGAPLARRLRSAEDVDAYIRAAGESRGAHRLTAALYRPDHGVVSRGEAYPSLPPTAERLLSSGQGTVLGHRVSELARAENLLDGPAIGGRVLALEIGKPVPENAR